MTFIFLNWGNHFVIGSCKFNFFSSYNIMASTEVIGFVIEAILKRVSVVINSYVSKFLYPKLSRYTTRPSFQIMQLTPPNFLLSISVLNISVFCLKFFGFLSAWALSGGHCELGEFDACPAAKPV